MTKEKTKREPNEWTKCVAKVRAENPKMKAGDIYKKASKIYKK